MDERSFVADRLAAPFGVVSAVVPLPGLRGLPHLAGYQAQIGSGVPGAGYSGKPVAGYGSDASSETAGQRIAIAEALERYSAGDFLQEDRVWARASELDGEVLDLGSVARCSEREYSDSRCPFVPPDPDAEIRWVRGLDLVTGNSAWIPAVMACYTMKDLRPQERFWYQISTGYAVHSDPAEALVRGILEVIERDAIALIWLQKIAPPILEPQRSAELDELASWSGRHFIETYLFNASTDLRVPVVYCLQIAPYDSLAHQVVGCAAARDLTTAARKALLECTMVRTSFYSRDPVPASPAEFTSFQDGGRYMGVPERRSAFDFLFDSRRVPAADTVPLPEKPDGALAALCSILSARNMPVFAVDRTPRELASVGLTAVSVVIPGLQPMSLHPYGKFADSDRLRRAPKDMGLMPLPEESLNPWPQPFT